jgi:biopolymer transport protein ExbB
MDVTLNTTSAGAGVAAKVAGYPVAVRLTADNFDFSLAKPDGSDIRVSQGAAAAPFVVEYFDPAAKKGALWVKLDVEGNSDAQKFRLHWGNPAAAAAGDSKAVFAEADGYLGVWHLGEDGAADSGAFKDVAGSNNATGVNLEKGSSVEGVVGMGNKLLNANKQWIKVDDPDGKFRPAQMTASIWAWADGFPGRWGKDHILGYQTVFSSGEGWTVQREMGGHIESCMGDCGIGKAMDLKKWYHFVVRRNGGSFQLFMNGAQVAGATAGNRTKKVPLGFGEMTEWYTYPGEQRSWEGVMDEARVMNKAMSNDWIKLEYESQRPDGKFLTFSKPEVAGISGQGLRRDRGAAASARAFDARGRMLKRGRAAVVGLTTPR